MTNDVKISVVSLKGSEKDRLSTLFSCFYLFNVLKVYNPYFSTSHNISYDILPCVPSSGIYKQTIKTCPCKCLCFVMLCKFYVYIKFTYM